MRLRTYPLANGAQEPRNDAEGQRRRLRAGGNMLCVHDRPQEPPEHQGGAGQGAGDHLSYGINQQVPGGVVDARKQGDRAILFLHDRPKKSPGAGNQKKPQTCDPCAEAVIIYTLGKCNLTRDQILYELPASFINQLMSCAWIEAGREIEGIADRGKTAEDIHAKLLAIARRPKPKFDL